MFYDFHIHTGLSACADKDMTPNNIVNMVYLNKLEAIAITDHNSAKNVEAVFRAKEHLKRDILIIPGMEVETSEEIHMICLLPTLEAALKLDKIIYEALPPIKNRQDVYGKQVLYDEMDRIIGEEEKLLSIATSISVDELVGLVNELGGFIYPSHIDREMNSMLYTLGIIPDDLAIGGVEISRYCDKNAFLEINKKNIPPQTHIFTSSDAHRLEQIALREHELMICEELQKNLQVPSLIKYLKNTYAIDKNV